MAISLSDPPRADDEQTRGRLVEHLTNAPADRKAEVLACIQGRLATLGRLGARANRAEAQGEITRAAAAAYVQACREVAVDIFTGPNWPPKPWASRERPARPSKVAPFGEGQGQ
jgi:hypothetical protein